jgi:voltage-gated potassium channel
VTTVTTVGYGHRYPITGQGASSGVLMLAGITLLCVVTASFAFWLLNKTREVEEHAQAVTRGDMAALTVEVRALREELAARSR